MTLLILIARDVVEGEFGKNENNVLSVKIYKDWQWCASVHRLVHMVNTYPTSAMPPHSSQVRVPVS